ncbi:polyphenol oxidase family protein [Thermovirga sp.]|uniref:polyphenol oxidase family protein n=1 Tax=Thermovirga sp. TaxID=2699834 RepID=UPI0025CDA93D|nr:polyphenol oxidase family protein [Thermovirga sp.]MBO8153184.1 polyphenol oxidase family protein [Thermovirga sp.]MCD6183230.1 polyphenol oxidase family protein [Thermovirga sp.]
MGDIPNLLPNYEVKKNEGQYILKYVAPPSYKGSAMLFMKGPLLENTCGNPEKIAEKIFYSKDKKPIMAPKQVHGVKILEPSPSMYLPYRPEGDGVIIDRVGILGSLRFADCFPIIIQGLRPKPWIAIAHSGFKGTLKNIAKALIEKIIDKFDIQGAEDIIGWIGPGICKNCYYRVKDEPLTEEAMKLFPEEHWRVENDRVFFDIAGAIKKQLCDLGLSSQAVKIIDLCSSCNNDLLYSYRQGDVEDRNFLLCSLGD